jgi:hypothetical protein
MRESADGGYTWGPERSIARLEGLTLHAAVSLVTQSGNIHLFFNIFKNFDGNRFEECNSDLGQTVSRDGGRSWSEPEVVKTGYRYLGALRNVIQLQNGRIVLPYCFYTKEKLFRVSTSYSDDQGKSWKNSPSILDVGMDNSGRPTFETGATEPVILELKDGRIWMLIRSTTGLQWQSFSDDQGVSWKEPVPSPFISSNCPANLLRLRDGRIVIVWDNTNTHKYGREVINIAISADDGKTWTGYREIARLKAHDDPDWRVCYPFPIEDPHGNILVAYWKFLSPKVSTHHQMFLVRVNPDWIEEKIQQVDFNSGLSDSSVTGSMGVEVVHQPGEKSSKVLSLQRVSASAEAGVVMNFPLQANGVLAVKLRLNSGSAGLRLFLKDSFMKPKDAGNGSLALEIKGGERIKAGSGNSGSQLVELSGRAVVNQWHELKVQWSAESRQASTFLDGQLVGDFDFASAKNGLCYLGLYAAARSVEQGSVWISEIRVSPHE